MPSPALQAWSSDSAARIGELRHAHQSVGGSGPGRRHRTEQLNWALVLLVAAEFQRYCRGLHDLAVGEIVHQTTGLNMVLASSLRVIMTDNRWLDRGNAHSKNLASDFGRLGMQLWPELERRKPVIAKALQAHIEALNNARNAIAHGQPAKLNAMATAGYPLSRLSTVQRFYGAANSLAGLMDATVAAYLVRVFGGPAPW